MRIGGYDVVREIARGGMAEVYLVERTGPEGFRARFALKKIRAQYASDEEFARLFVNEARVSSLLEHRNIVRIFDFGQESDGSLYLVMEYIEGLDLRSLQRRLDAQDRRLDLALSCYVVASLLRALHYAHEKTGDQGKSLNLIHRDVSPHNLLLSRNGDVKLADFGIAKAVFTTVKTAQGFVRGKLGYLAPEQFRGQPISQAVDIFASGIILAELLHVVASPQGTSKDLIHRNATGKILDEEAARDVPAGLVDLLRHMTAPNPAHRPTARQALEALAAGGWDRDRSLALADLVQRVLSEKEQPRKEEPPPPDPSDLDSLPESALLDVQDTSAAAPAVEPPRAEPTPGDDGATESPGVQESDSLPRDHKLKVRPIHVRFLMGLTALIVSLAALWLWTRRPGHSTGRRVPNPHWARMQLDAEASHMAIQLDGVELGPGLVELRVQPGPHEVQFVAPGGTTPCGRWSGFLRPGQAIVLKTPGSCGGGRP